MVYKVIGLMSGSSLDGLDIIYTHLEEARGAWKYEIKHAACLPYSEDWQKDLNAVQNLSAPEFLKLHTRYGKFLADQIKNFITGNALQHQVDFIASHGHTAFHDPEAHTSAQLGCGATIAAHLQLPVISELRAMDVALGGQGAPIVPIGDKLLFSGYDYWLNIGGIVNISVKGADGIHAFDVCPGNQVLNILAEKEGKDMDENGDMAREGNLLQGVLSRLNEQAYFQESPPKSLNNDAAKQLAFPILLESAHDVKDLLHTFVCHIAEQVALGIKQKPATPENARMLITGGGAFNGFLIEKITEQLRDSQVEIVIPDAQTIKFKEALVMSLIGALRWREEVNVLSSATGASRDSVSGALWMGHS
ncbi:MAG TPA: anhydro-N-acetylmuramic acid kinase [Flavipsychrobacter sp.]|nr:anhydro-N-acetylmuramic acid kinase [Flavipsychrobacter sp.]